MIWQTMCWDISGKAEQERMEEGYDRASDAVRMILSGDIGGAMSRYNRKIE